MSDPFDRLIGPLLAKEGGYVDHPADRGGPTNFGITEAVARANGYTGPMRSMPLETAKAIYRKRYWTGPRFDLIAPSSVKIAEELFDTGVNMGPAVASRFLQRALNVLNRQGKDYPDIAVDGAIGPATLRALRGLFAARGVAAEAVMLRALNGLQAARYIELAETRGSQEAFAFGWLAHRVGMA